MLIQLKDSPEVCLVVFLVFRIDSIELSGSAGRREEGAVEKAGETFQGSRQSRSRNAEVVVGICGGCICVGASAMLR